MAKDNRIQYIFTKYVEVALTHTRGNYLKKKLQLEHTEELTQEGWEWLEQKARREELWEEPWTGLPDSPGDIHAIRLFFNLGLEEPVRAAVACLQDIEIFILYAKVFLQMSHQEIGMVLGITGEKSASLYAYTKKKIRRMLKNGF